MIMITIISLILSAMSIRFCIKWRVGEQVVVMIASFWGRRHTVRIDIIYARLFAYLCVVASTI